MLKDKKLHVERLADERRLRAQMTMEYGGFLGTVFSPRDWFATFTFRDRHQDADKILEKSKKMGSRGFGRNQITTYSRDPRLDSWEPDSKNRRKPGPPVRDAALREIKHFLMELGWEAAGHTRQELFNMLAEGLTGSARRNLAKTVCRKCLCCALLEDPLAFPCFYEVLEVATTSIGWVIAEEFGRAGGRWHVHLLIRGVQSLRRKKWWRRAFLRFGRSRIEAIHD